MAFIFQSQGIESVLRLASKLFIFGHGDGSVGSYISLAGIGRTSEVEVFGFFLLLDVDTDFLVIFLADPIRFESDSDFSHSMSRDGASRRYIGEGRAGVCIIDTSAYFHQSELDLEVADIADLYHTFRIFIQQNSSHGH